ncbi:hypothetical protein OHA72_47620 [Dactylosporangium sp. NBC_01737]|uniref:hypothetical protein n=1 Tax=Dactylosporangium sp. NBC_01737 TaxID=2975959 RepID=UPI002E106A50|nr:hypothetical protein OHA72_47620 [Dactylosporangium sp. NBC_01737]
MVEQVHLEVLGGGHRTDGELARPVATLQQLSYFRLAARIRELAAGGHTAAQIAHRLGDEGFHPSKRRERFGAQGFRDIMQRLDCASQPEHPAGAGALRLGEHEWWLSDLARAIGMPKVTLFCWLQRGFHSTPN